MGCIQESRQPKQAWRFLEEASVLFNDGVDCLEIFDAKHSDEEDRFISIGPVERGLVLVVWTERLDDVIRIISARWTTRREAELYRAYQERHR